MPGFYAPGFDPLLILAQIAALQATWYLTYGAWTLLFHALAGKATPNLGLHHLFDAQNFNVGWTQTAAFSLNAITGAIIIVPIVQRAKKVLDFAATVHFNHLILCLFFDAEFHSSWTFWTHMGVSLITMSLLGEYLCMRHEMQEIPLLGDIAQQLGKDAV